MIDKDQVKQLLGHGVDHQVVASALGTSTSYIGQLLSDAAFKAEVDALRNSSLSKAAARDEKIDNIENSLLDKMSEVMDLFYKPRDVLQALAVVNKMTRRGLPADHATFDKAQVVNLNVPQVLIQQVTQNFVMNAQGEVVQVGDQTMVSMPAHQLLRELQTANKGNGADERYRKVASYLPGSAGIEVGVSRES